MSYRPIMVFGLLKEYQWAAAHALIAGVRKYQKRNIKQASLTVQNLLHCRPARAAIAMRGFLRRTRF